MEEMSYVLPLIIPFLPWRDRWRLAHASRVMRSIILDVKYEREAFLHIAKVYNSFIDVFETATSPDGGWYPSCPYWRFKFKDVCEPNPKLLVIKSWLGALLRIEAQYERQLKFPPTLPVADEVWKVLPDERLDLLVKRVQFLCSGFVTEGFSLWEGCSYLIFVKRYAYPKHQKFSVKNFLTLVDNEKYLMLKSAATICDVLDEYQQMNIEMIARDMVKFCSYMEDTPDHYLETAVRLVYLPQKGMLTSIHSCGLPSVLKRIALQPFITRAAMRNQDLMDSYAFEPNRSPYHFLRWLTGIDNGSSRDPSLQQYGPAIDQLKDHPDLLSLDPAIFWDVQQLNLAKVEAEKLGDDWCANLGGPHHEKSEVLSVYEVQFYDAHWKYAMHQIEEHLATVFRPFNMEEAQRLKDAYAECGLQLIQSGDPEGSAGAYLEMTLSDSVSGPNDTCATNDHQNIAVVLYAGPDDAVLYEFKDG